MQNEIYTVAPKPQAKKRKGKVLAVIALVMGILSMVLAGLSFWAVFWLAYGRENMLVIRTSFCSIVFAITAIVAIILGIIAKRRGSHVAMLIATIVTSIQAFPWVAFNIYILIYYIGLTY